MLEVYVSGEVKYAVSSANKFDKTKEDYFILLKLSEMPDQGLKDTVPINIAGATHRLSIIEGDRLFIKGASLDSYINKTGQLIATMKATPSVVLNIRDGSIINSNIVYGSGIRILSDTIDIYGKYNTCTCKYTTVKYNKEKEKTVIEKEFEAIWPITDDVITRYVQRSANRDIMMIGAIVPIPISPDPNSKATTSVVFMYEIRLIG